MMSRVRVLKWVALGLGLLLIGLWPGLVENNKFWVTLGAQAAILMLLSSSLNLALGFTDLVSMAHTGIYAVGAYACGLIVTRLGLDFWLALPLATLVAGAVGGLMTLATLRAAHLYFAMVTLSFNLILLQLAFAWEGLTGGEGGLIGIKRPALGGQRLDLNQYYYLIWVLVLVSLWLIFNLVRSKFGRAFISIRGDEATAASLGVNPFKYKLISFATSSAFAGMAGALYAHLNGFVNPALGDSSGSLSLFVALFIGGVGTLSGPLLGVIFATGIERLLMVGGDALNKATNTASNTSYQALAYGLLLILTMAVLPSGIVGTWTKSKAGRKWSNFLAQLHPLPKPQELRVASSGLHIENQKPSTHNSFTTENTEVSQLLTRNPVPTDNRQPITDNLLNVSGMTKSFGGLRALRGVDMQIEPGEVRGLIGPNGSGKSTFVNVISGHLPYDSGQIEFGGEKLNRPATYQLAKRGQVRIFQAAHLFPNLSVVENMLAGFHNHSRQNFIEAALHLPHQREEEARLRQEAVNYLALVGLSERALTLAGSLSHGQQRLLEVARALAVGPRLLILDEPATGLTAEELRGLSSLIASLKQQHISVLLIEHNIDFLMRLCDRVSVFEYGEKIAEGTPAEVQSNPRVVVAYLGEPETIEESKVRP